MTVVSAAEEAAPGKRGRKGEERSKDTSKRVPHESFTKGWHVYILWRGHAKMVGRWILKISRAQKKLVHLISGASF